MFFPSEGGEQQKNHHTYIFPHSNYLTFIKIPSTDTGQEGKYCQDEKIDPAKGKPSNYQGVPDRLAEHSVYKYFNYSRLNSRMFKWVYPPLSLRHSTTDTADFNIKPFYQSCFNSPLIPKFINVPADPASQWRPHSTQETVLSLDDEIIEKSPSTFRKCGACAVETPESLVGDKER